MYNAANFHIRQAYSGVKKPAHERHLNEQEVLMLISDNIDTLNQIKTDTFNKKLEKAKASGKKLKVSEPTLFAEPCEKKSFLSYGLLEGLFKVTNQADYRNLPGQVNQQTMRLLYRDWKSFFESIKEYKSSPDKFTGKPKPPKYAHKNGRKPAVFTGQICLLKESSGEKHLTFPKTKQVLSFGSYDLFEGTLKEVRIIPNANFYTIELVMELPEPKIDFESHISSRVIGIDLGVENFAAIANNIGKSPIVIKGGILKSRNQLYNKQRAHYYRILRMGKSQNEGQFSSKRLERIDANRHAFFKDYFHKASKLILAYCKENGIDTIVIGKNANWKKDVQLRKSDKQNFISIPYNRFIETLTYKAHAMGILVVLTEESYTSKASFIDGDYMPTYGVDDDKVSFSGRRIKRGLYRSKSGMVINADVNGAFNMIRKVFPKAFDSLNVRRDSGVVNSPVSLLVA